ncbi:hypothetical protein ISN44_As10g000780 [Arabidopsis suecica]|uniref:Uncharacterized protein n=1 Tax=Arabidopsis suecica TaxID=45249 RepID=A0A8T1ZR13_ARASU|nr:hypothetical protein ISN44_As10g000780 [Arabidopsis suecica]KAG7563251.1 hypothetical protein ISN44_As10g000780 [Arabidopsis suecica]KAG7563252.1 hypothetical protein ISN44_As10g000780 [Arabidopsis suecica]
MVVYLCLPSWNKVMAWEMSFLSYGSNVISRPRLFVFTYKRRNWYLKQLTVFLKQRQKQNTFSCGIFFLHLMAFCRIKSRDNRDKTVELLHKFARSNFPPVKYMEYAVQVETYTLSKANNLVLNVNKTLDLSLLGPSCPKWDVH